MNVGIIGAGAAGMAAAIRASENGHNVTILEHNDKAGKKILQTGNGKCNYTNRLMNKECYNVSGRELFEAVYSEFDFSDTIRFFEEIGIVPYEKNGYFYPSSEQAKGVVDCLLHELKRQGVSIVYNCTITGIKKEKNFIVFTDGKDYVFDRLIIATGSNAAPKSGSDGSGYGLAIKLGHTVKKPLPALCGLKCGGANFKSISGVRCQAQVTLFSNGKEINKDAGELQLADYGISGIPVFQISSEAIRRNDKGENVSIVVDYANNYTEQELADYLKVRMDMLKEKDAEHFLDGMFNSKLCSYFTDGLADKNVSVSSLDKNKFITELVIKIKKSEYTVKGHRGFDNCQVCSGGILCEDVKNSLESKITDGLYFAGEILDVDGICGGYNLQWAWSSGMVAGSLL